MQVVFYLDCVSPHQVPLAREVVKNTSRNSLLLVGMGCS